MQITQIIPTNKGIKDNVYFCSGMKKTPDGNVSSGYQFSNVAQYTASSSTARLSTMRKFVDREYGQYASTWGLNPYYKGGLWVIPKYGSEVKQAIDLGLTPGDDWSTTNEDIGTSSVLEVSNDNEIIYSGRKYVGKSITSTLNGAISDTDTSIVITDATSFPSSGQAVIVDGNHAECIEYTGISTNTLTGVTRNKYYTTARAWSSGKEIVGFRNHWLTWTSGLGSTTKSPSVKWEDHIFVGRGHTIGGWKENDGSDFDETMLTLPANYEIVGMTTLLTGAGTMVLIAANRENAGDIFIWNGVDKTWSRIVACEENIKAIDKNIVALGTGLYQTDTYSLSLLAELPDNKNDITLSEFKVSDIKIHKNEVLCLLSAGDKRPRYKSGLWIYNLADRDWLFVPPYERETVITMGTIFVSSEWKILVSKYNSIDRLNSGYSSKESYYQILYNPNNGNIFKLQELKLNLHPVSDKYWLEAADSSDMDIDVIVRVFDFQRPFYEYLQTSGAGTDASHFAVTKTQGMPRVGDRIEIQDNGGNDAIAGLPRNITAITTGASTYTLTLDEALPETLTDYAKNIILNPLKKLKTITLDSYKIDPDKLRIIPNGQPKFKKLMIEVEIRDKGDKTYSPQIQLNSIELKMEVL